MSNTDITLTVRDGRLHTPVELLTDPAEQAWYASDPALIYSYPAGDYDMIAWPNPDIEHLRAALFDAREIGHIPTGATVRLPDGIIVDF